MVFSKVKRRKSKPPLRKFKDLIDNEFNISPKILFIYELLTHFYE